MLREIFLSLRNLGVYLRDVVVLNLFFSREMLCHIRLSETYGMLPQDVARISCHRSVMLLLLLLRG